MEIPDLREQHKRRVYLGKGNYRVEADGTWEDVLGSVSEN